MRDSQREPDADVVRVSVLESQEASDRFGVTAIFQARRNHFSKRTVKFVAVRRIEEILISVLHRNKTRSDRGVHRPQNPKPENESDDDEHMA